MKPRLMVAIGAAVVLLVGIGGAFYWSSSRSAPSSIRYHMPQSCEQRLAAQLANEERIKREAHDRLRIGKTREDVAGFFAANRLAADLFLVAGEEVATGTIRSSGDYECHPITGCSSDAHFFQVSVKIDAVGTVASEPVFSGGYEDCV